jgi:hypothetical protein
MCCAGIRRRSNDGARKCWAKNNGRRWEARRKGAYADRSDNIVLGTRQDATAVLQTLHDAIVKVAKDPQVVAKIRVQGITPVAIGLKDFEAYIRNGMQRLSPLLANIAQSKG